MTLAVELILHRGDREIAARFQVGQEVLAIVGPNGAGKTSLLLAMLGLRRAHAGRLVLGPRVLFDATNHIDVPTDRRAIGYVPQDYALFPHLTALGNVEFALGCAVPALSRASRRARAEELLHSLGIHGIRDRWPATLSGGEKQRLALARALATQPQALLLDEPLAALDVGARREVRRSLGQHLRALGLPALVVTHDLDDVRVVADRVLVLEEGRIVQEGTLAELASCPATAYIEQFVHPHRMAAPVS